MRIERFDPKTDPASLSEFYAVYAASDALDDPDGPTVDLSAADLDRLADPVRGMLQGRRTFAGRWTLGADGHPQQTWLARDAAGAVVGCCLLELPEHDYPNVAFCYPVVMPAVRRQGIGRALMARAAAEAAHAGRSILMGYARVGSSGVGFAEKSGGRRNPPTNDQRRVLTLDAGFEDRTRGLRAEAASAAVGYTLLSWQDKAPEDTLDGLAHLALSMGDAPRPDSMALEEGDPDLVRAAEARARRLGARSLSVAAHHTASGEVVAVSNLSLDPLIDGWAFQGITVVDRGHRGHRLGLLVKAELHLRLAELFPAVRRVMTTNHQTNTSMVGINDRLGFRVTDEFTTFEWDLDG